MAAWLCSRSGAVLAGCQTKSIKGLVVRELSGADLT